ncbi:MAG: alanyl-tRNA editing protein [Anaerolineae bacterium]|nr:alanyl-tRNA editing protein [Anaerolineae bacterium]
MTELLYQTDSYLREFEAVVTSVDVAARTVTLNRTAFYPGGGGQPCDAGELEVGGRRYAVVRVERGNLHVLDGDLMPEVGDAVMGRLDWDRRFQLMRTHTAMHILCGVVWRDYGASVTGGNMEPLEGRMDFEFERLQKEFVQEIEDKINVEVRAARDVLVRILPRDEAFQIPDLIRTKINLLPEGIREVRTVEIVGLDLQADGGTHVNNTRAVGRMRIADYKSKGGINKRIYVRIEDDDQP